MPRSKARKQNLLRERGMRKIFMACVFSASVFQPAFAEEPENIWLKVVEPMMGPASEPTAGMTKKQFFKGRGIPDKREIRNGEEVLWFDGDEPYYAHFKNNKLTSYYLDKETIARRTEETRRYDEELRQGQENFERAQYEAQAQEQSRKQNAIRAMGDIFKPQPMPYQIPVQKSTTTNCYPGIGGSVQCTSY